MTCSYEWRKVPEMRKRKQGGSVGHIKAGEGN